jgi:hypothetical protein
MPNQPENWQPPYQGETFSLYRLSRHLAKLGHVITAVGWPGTCSVQPIHAATRSNHSCGQFDVADHMLGHWDVWARGGEYRQQLDAAAAEIKRLKALAAARLDALRKLRTPKPSRKAKPHAAADTANDHDHAA